MITLKTSPNSRGIELGGGDCPLVRPNCDIRPCYDANGNPTVDFTADFNEPLPIKDDDFDFVFSKFAIEHISYLKVPQFISEIFRIIKPGGKTVIVTANTEAQVKWILEHPEGWDGKDFFTSASEKLFGSQDYKANFHCAYFSPGVLVALFTKAGFVNIKTTPYGTRDTDICVEATKPEKQTNTKEQEVQKMIQIVSNLSTLAHSSTQPNPLPDKVLEYEPEKIFNREYFDGGKLGGGYAHGGYRDFPAHEITVSHILARKPGSVLEFGAARGYLVKRLQDRGLNAWGMDVSKHCYMTRACENLITHNFQYATPKIGHFDLAFSINFLEHIPEEHIPQLIREMYAICKRGLHGISFSGESDRTKFTVKPREWWVEQFNKHAPGWPVEIVASSELESGPFPEEVLKGDGKVKLNLGSFISMWHHSWVNVDQVDLSQFAQSNGYRFQQHDLRNPLPWQTGSVDLVTFSHCLEHFSFPIGLSILRDIRRVLKPEGVLRVAVPDAALLIDAYQDKQVNQFDEISNGCAAAKTSARKLWEVLHAGHEAIYDETTLLDALENSGFTPEISSFREDKESHPGCQQIRRETTDVGVSHSLYCWAFPKVG